MLRDGEQKEHTILYSKIYHGGQILPNYLGPNYLGLLTCSYIGELRTGRKLKCDNEPFVVFILFLR